MRTTIKISGLNDLIMNKPELTTKGGQYLWNNDNKRQWYRSIAQNILSISKTLVPVDTGQLRDSGHLEENGDGTYKIVYSEPYAAFVHENMSTSHTQPTQAKYLEDAAYMLIYYLSSKTGDNKPVFTFHLEIDMSIELYIDSVDMDEFISTSRELGWEVGDIE